MLPVSSFFVIGDFFYIKHMLHFPRFSAHARSLRILFINTAFIANVIIITIAE